MKGKIIFLIVLLPALCFAGESKVFTDSDLKTYSGGVESSSDSNYCSVVDYDSYAQTHSIPGSGYTTSYGTGVYSGRMQWEGPTYLSVRIQNNSKQERIVYTSRDIKVRTIKGSVISPKDSETYEIKPGEIITINGLKLGKVSKIVSVECSCW